MTNKDACHSAVTISIYYLSFLPLFIVQTWKIKYHIFLVLYVISKSELTLLQLDFP